MILVYTIPGAFAGELTLADINQIPQLLHELFEIYAIYARGIFKGFKAGHIAANAGHAVLQENGDDLRAAFQQLGD